MILFALLSLSVAGSLLDELETMLAVADKVAPQGLIILRTLDTYDDPVLVQRDFECPCGRDVLRLCDVHGNDDYTSVYEKRLCLARNAMEVTPMCMAHLLGSPTVVEYCASDIDFYCPNVDPGENRVHTCLAKNELLPECAMYIASVAPPAFVVKTVVIEEEEDTTPDEEEPDEEEPPKEKPPIFLITAVLVSVVALLAVCLSYACRKYKAKKQAHDFKTKFAPLLIEAPAEE